MASSTIPESVLGIPLFVPDGNDYFEIVPAGMPNGDPSLRVRGDLSREYKAFQPAPATTPALNNDGSVFTLNFWIKAPSTGAPAGTYNNCIISMMKSTNASTGVNTNALWTVAAASLTGSLQVLRGTASGGNFIFSVTTPSILPYPRDTTWHMVTVTFPSASAPDNVGGIYVDEEVAPRAEDAQPLPSDVMTDVFLCIGSYATNVPNSLGWEADYELGKLSFHDGHLNQTQRSLLYNAMVN